MLDSTSINAILAQQNASFAQQQFIAQSLTQQFALIPTPLQQTAPMIPGTSVVPTLDPRFQQAIMAPQGFQYGVPPWAQVWGGPSAAGATLVSQGLPAAWEFLTTAAFVGAGAIFPAWFDWFKPVTVPLFAGAKTGWRFLQAGEIGAAAGAFGRGLLAALPSLGLLMGIGAGAHAIMKQISTGALELHAMHQWLLHNATRATLPSMGGYVWQSEDAAEMLRMIYRMRQRDIWLEPTEVLNVAQIGFQQRWFTGVRTPEDFRSQLHDIVETLRDIARAFGTTLEGAAPYYAGFRAGGFVGPRGGLSLETIRFTAGLARASELGSPEQFFMAMQQAVREGVAAGLSARDIRQGEIFAQTRLAGIAYGVTQGIIPQDIVFSLTGQIGPQGAIALNQLLQQYAGVALQGPFGRWLSMALTDPLTGSLRAGPYPGETLGGLLSAARETVSTREGIIQWMLHGQENIERALQRYGPAYLAGTHIEMLARAYERHGIRDQDLIDLLVMRRTGIPQRMQYLLRAFAAMTPYLEARVRQRAEEEMLQAQREAEFAEYGTIEGLLRRLEIETIEPIAEEFREIGRGINTAIMRGIRSVLEKITGRELPVPGRPQAVRGFLSDIMSGRISSTVLHSLPMSSATRLRLAIEAPSSVQVRPEDLKRVILPPAWAYGEPSGVGFLTSSSFGARVEQAGLSIASDLALAAIGRGLPEIGELINEFGGGLRAIGQGIYQDADLANRIIRQNIYKQVLMERGATAAEASEIISDTARMSRILQEEAFAARVAELSELTAGRVLGRTLWWPFKTIGQFYGGAIRLGGGIVSGIGLGLRGIGYTLKGPLPVHIATSLLFGGIEAYYARQSGFTGPMAEVAAYWAGAKEGIPIIDESWLVTWGKYSLSAATFGLYRPSYMHVDPERALRVAELAVTEVPADFSKIPKEILDDLTREVTNVNSQLSTKARTNVGAHTTLRVSLLNLRTRYENEGRPDKANEIDKILQDLDAKTSQTPDYAGAFLLYAQVRQGKISFLEAVNPKIKLEEERQRTIKYSQLFKRWYRGGTWYFSDEIERIISGKATKEQEENLSTAARYFIRAKSTTDREQKIEALLAVYDYLALVSGGSLTINREEILANPEAAEQAFSRLFLGGPGEVPKNQIFYSKPGEIPPEARVRGFTYPKPYLGFMQLDKNLRQVVDQSIEEAIRRLNDMHNSINEALERLRAQEEVMERFTPRTARQRQQIAQRLEDVRKSQEELQRWQQVLQTGGYPALEEQIQKAPTPMLEALWEAGFYQVGPEVTARRFLRMGQAGISALLLTRGYKDLIEQQYQGIDLTKEEKEIFAMREAAASIAKSAGMSAEEAFEILRDIHRGETKGGPATQERRLQVLRALVKEPVKAGRGDPYQTLNNLAGALDKLGAVLAQANKVPWPPTSTMLTAGDNKTAPGGNSGGPP